MTNNNINTTDIQKVNPETLVDIQSVHIDNSLSKQERIQSYIKQIKNPYCFKCGNMVVKTSFADNGEPLEKLMENLILNL